jgi:hypothetical protein
MCHSPPGAGPCAGPTAGLSSHSTSSLGPVLPGYFFPAHSCLGPQPALWRLTPYATLSTLCQ